ncbi:MAG: hypothetical protein HOQ21_05990 [Dermatophilaceae bacterium]|nr:hypothetical protein [Dermatophilaceae bacterium]
MMFYGESVVVRTAGTVTDPYSGQAVPSWDATPIERTVDNVLVADGGSTEPQQDARNSVDSDFDLIFQAGSVPPSAQDRVVVRGLVCEVAGRPFLWRWPGSGDDAGTVVKVKIREG